MVHTKIARGNLLQAQNKGCVIASIKFGVGRRAVSKLAVSITPASVVASSHVHPLALAVLLHIAIAFVAA